MITDQKILSELHFHQKQALDHYFASLDLDAAHEILDTLEQCEGIFHFTGVGKSGLIADKIARTLTSFGIKALFIHPLDGVHGDLGLAAKKDHLIVLSKSGQGKELADLMRAAKRKQLQVILWTSSAAAPLKELSDKMMLLPDLEEICPFGKAPTLSSTAQMLFGDMITVALAQRKQVSMEAYALNHPSGKIGKDILRVKDVMLQGAAIPVVAPLQKLSEVICDLSDKRCGCLLVVENKRLLGIFTDGDLRRALIGGNIANLFQQEMAAIMTRDFFSIHPLMLVQDAIKVMQANGKRRVLVLPVIEEQELVGIVTLHDLTIAQ